MMTTYPFAALFRLGEWNDCRLTCKVGPEVTYALRVNPGQVDVNAIHVGQGAVVLQLLQGRLNGDLGTLWRLCRDDEENRHTIFS